MKIKNLMAIAILLFFVNDAFATYIRVTNNGGPHGYYATSKDVNDCGDTYITCLDPGFSDCPLRPANPNHDNLVEAAVEAIHNGKLSGSIISPDGNVTWTSDNANMTNSRIVIE